MAGVTHIEIQGSVEVLEQLVKNHKEARLKERIQALYRIKAQGMSVCAKPSPIRDAPRSLLLRRSTASR